MKVKIRNLANNPMQSGRGKENLWLLTFPNNLGDRNINDVTGWTSSKNTKTQMKLKFENKEDAIEYAIENGFDYEIYEANKSQAQKSAKSYVQNFTKKIL